MSRQSAVEAMMRYCERELSAALAELLLEHTQSACEVAEVEAPELPELLGEDVFAVFFMCVVEDFMTRPAAPGGVNVTDAFLKRHGWKHSAATRREFQAIRDSVMGLYEITALRSDGTVELRDVLLEGPPIELMESGLDEALPVGALFAARLVGERGAVRMTEGLLPMPAEWADDAVAYLREAASIGERPFVRADLPALAPLFSNFWLTETLSDDADEIQDDDEFEVIDADEAERPN